MSSSNYDHKDSCFSELAVNLFLEGMQAIATECDVDELRLQQQKKAAWDDERRVPPNFHSTAREVCCPNYYEVFQCYMATIRKQYWLGMGFSNVYVYADDTVWFHCSSEGNIHCERKTTLSN